MNHVSSGHWRNLLVSIGALAMILAAAPSLAKAADPPVPASTIEDEKRKSGGAGKIQQRAVKPPAPKPSPPLQPSLSPPSPPSGPIPLPYPNDTAKESEKVAR
jgi:hypothetical protein